MNYKHISVLFLILFSACILQAQKLTAVLENHQITVGEPVYLTLTSDTASVPRFADGPPRVNGIRWYSGESTKRSVQIVNGSYSSTTQNTYTFVPLRPGSCVIPAAKVSLGKKTVMSEEIRFTVSAQNQNPVNSGNFSDTAFARIILPERKVFTAGEEIPVEVRLYCLQGVDIVAMNYPEITAENKTPLIFHDYGKLNPRNSSFEPPRETNSILRGRNFSCYSFRTAIRVVEPGKLQLAAAFQTEIRIRDNRRRSQSSLFDDDFFNPFGSRGRVIRKVITAKADSSILIKKMLPLPPDTFFTGLIGDWVLSARLSSEKAKVGEVLTLTIAAMNGTSSSESLKPPALDFHGFRVYAPETERSGNGHAILIKYILIPTEPGEKEIAFKAASFHPEQEKYNILSFRKKVKISPGAAAPAVQHHAQLPQGKAAPENTRKDSLLYLKSKNELDKKVLKPYYRNTLISCLCILLAGIVFRILCELIRSRRLHHDQNPAFRRRENARRTKRKLLSELRNTPANAITEKSSAITSFAADALNLPPGATLQDAADQTEQKNPELSESLKKLSELSWLPGGAAAFTEEMKKKLIRSLEKLIVAALILTIPAAEAGEILSPESAMTAYDAGHFQQAYDYYQKLSSSASPSPAVYYNLGNCLYQMGNYAGALANYEIAMRLSPRDTDLLENLNLTRRKLSLPEKYQINSPADILPFLRDSLRPDEWYLLIAFGIALILAGDGLRRVISRKRLWLSIMGPGILLLLISLTAVLSQSTAAYASGKALVNSETRIHPRSLPAETAPEMETLFSPGEEVRIEERRNKWVRVRSGETEGWIRESRISEL